MIYGLSLSAMTGDMCGSKLKKGTKSYFRGPRRRFHSFPFLPSSLLIFTQLHTTDTHSPSWKMTGHRPFILPMAPISTNPFFSHYGSPQQPLTTNGSSSSLRSVILMLLSVYTSKYSFMLDATESDYLILNQFKQCSISPLLGVESFVSPFLYRFIGEYEIGRSLSHVF